MRRVRDVIRMKAAGLPSREIARRVGAAPSTVRLAIRRFEAAGLTWPLPDELTDAGLEARLFAKTGNGNRQGHRRIAEPDWASVHRELKRKRVTHGRERLDAAAARAIDTSSGSPPAEAGAEALLGVRALVENEVTQRAGRRPNHGGILADTCVVQPA